jgi:ABC-2 type transport system ATP-binding protein
MAVQSSSPSIELKGVTKSFPLQTTGWLQRLRPERFTALAGVSFTVGHGESVAILGRNGAGKSTLLNLVSGVVPPTKGTVRTEGHLAALLELGTGFHPDLTGRENVFLNASLQGLTRAQTLKRFEAMVEFSELEEFINDPLRTYSSGMWLRLAFAIAVHSDPDILLIDEILAVGDDRFQKKCFDRMHEFRDQGKTILCASHVHAIVANLCDRAIWLEQGRVVRDGPLESVCQEYEHSLHAAEAPR